MKVLLCNFTQEKNISRGVGYLAASIISAGHELDYIELPTSKDYTLWINKYLAHNDILLVSSNSIQIQSSYRYIRQCKKVMPLIPTVLGGIHATILRERIFTECPEVDFICVGEGENMIKHLLDVIGTSELSSVDNLIYRENGNVICNNIAIPQDLSKLPQFPWELFPYESVVQSGSRFTYVHATRGCPHACSYCCNTSYLDLYGKEYIRYRPVDEVVDELNYLKNKYSPGLFYFGDESLLHNKEYCELLFSKIKEVVGLNYGFMGRPGQLKDDTIRMLNETGCRYVAIGVECGDEQFRQSYLERHESNEQIEYCFNCLKRNNIYSASFNIIGFPFAFDEHLTQQTIEFNKHVAPNYSMVSIFYPFPGTKMGNYCIENGLIDYTKMNFAQHYYDDSVLLHYELKEKRRAILSLLNNNEFGYGIYE